MMAQNKEYQAAPMDEDLIDEEASLTLEPMNISTDNGSLPRSIELSKRNIFLFVILGCFLFGFSYYTGTNAESSSWSTTTAPSFSTEGNTGINPNQIATSKPTNAAVVVPEAKVTSKPTSVPEVTSKPTDAPKVTPKPTDAPKVTAKPTDAPKVTSKPTDAPTLSTATPTISPTLSTRQPTTSPIQSTGQPTVTELTASPIKTPTKSTAKPTMPDNTAGTGSASGNYGAARKLVQDTMKMLENYYAPYKRMTSSWAFKEGDEHWEQSQDYMAKQIARAVVNKRTFVTAGIGSSVMAGHDNCNYDSFPSQLERFLKPIFVAAGADYEFRNAGEGGRCGDDMLNQAMCFVQNAGKDVDALVYTWSYFEHQKMHSLHEALARWSLMNDRQHPVSFIYMNGGKEVPCMAGHFTEYGNVYYQYAKYGMSTFCLAQATWIVPKNPTCMDRDGWNIPGDCQHNTTRYGLTDEGGAREKGLGVLWRNWHPGPLGFQMMADAYGYLYLDAMLRAFKLIEAETDQFSKFGDENWPELLQDDLPMPLYCDKSEWDWSCMADKPPECINFELPTYGPQGIEVVGSEDPKNPFTYDAEMWELKTERRENLVPKSDRKYGEKCTPLDKCGFYRTKAGMFEKAGTLAFRLPTEDKTGTVIICCASKNCAEKIKPEDVEFKLGGRVLDSAGWKYKFPNQKCLRLMQKFEVGDVAKGEKFAYLGVRMKADENLQISHVIMH